MPTLNIHHSLHFSSFYLLELLADVQVLLFHIDNHICLGLRIPAWLLVLGCCRSSYCTKVSGKNVAWSSLMEESRRQLLSWIFLNRHCSGRWVILSNTCYRSTRLHGNLHRWRRIVRSFCLEIPFLFSAARFKCRRLISLVFSAIVLKSRRESSPSILSEFAWGASFISSSFCCSATTLGEQLVILGSAQFTPVG